MKNIRPRHLFSSLLAFLLLASFTRPVEKIKLFAQENVSENTQNQPITEYSGVTLNPTKSYPILSYTPVLISNINSIETGNDSVSKNTDIDETRIGQSMGSIKPLPIKNNKKLYFNKLLASGIENAIEKEFYKYDSLVHSFRRIENIENRLGFDPVKFRVNSNKNTIRVGEEVEIKITAEFLDVSPRLIFQFEGSNEFTLKMLLPDGFIQTGGTYYDFIQGKVTKESPKQEFIIKGFFETGIENRCFSLLRSHAGAGLSSMWERKTIYCLQEDTSSGEQIAIAAKETRNGRILSAQSIYSGIEITVSASYDCITNKTTLHAKFVNTTTADKVIKAGWHVHNSISYCIVEGTFSGGKYGDDNGLSQTIGKKNDTNNSDEIQVDWEEEGRVKNHLDITIDNVRVENCNYSNFPITDINAPSSFSVAANPSTISAGQYSTLEYQGCGTGTVTYQEQVIPDSFGPPGFIVTPVITTKYIFTCTLNQCAATDVTTVYVGCPTQGPIISPEAAKEGDNLSATGCDRGIITWKKDGYPIQDSELISVTEGVYEATCNISGCDPKLSTKRIHFTCTPYEPIPAQPLYQVVPNNNANVKITNTCPRGTVYWYQCNQSNCSNPQNWPVYTSGTSVDLPIGTYTAKCIIDDSADCISGFSSIVTVTYTDSHFCYKPTPIITVKSNLQLECTTTCYTATNGQATAYGTLYWYKDGQQSNHGGSIIDGQRGSTYTVRCVVDDDCFSDLSEPVKLDCGLVTPKISGSSIVTIPEGTTTTLITPYTCSGGAFEWYKNNQHMPGEITNTITGSEVGKGEYKVRCKVKKDPEGVEDQSNYCYSTFSEIVKVINSNPCEGISLHAHSNATARTCAVSVGDLLNLNGGVDNGVQVDEMGWWKGSTKVTPNGLIGYYEFPQKAKKSDSGTYTFKVKKGNTWCVAPDIVIDICDCNLSVEPGYDIVGTNINISAIVTPSCPTCWVWTPPNGQPTRTDSSPFTVSNSELNKDIWSLTITKSPECVVTKTLDVKFRVPPSYNGNITNAFCENVNGFVYDQADNAGYKIPDLSLEIKKRLSGGGVQALNDITIPVAGNYFETLWPSNYKDGSEYEVKVKFPTDDPGKTGNNIYILPYRDTPAIIQCCTLVLDTSRESKSDCDQQTNKGYYTIYYKDHKETTVLKYRLSKLGYNSSQQSEYIALSDWVSGISLPRQGFLQFFNLERGFYRCELVEGANTDRKGCTVTTYFEVDCETPPPCGPTPLITVVPDGIIPEGEGITPTLHAEPTSATLDESTGLLKVAKLDGSSGIILNEGLGLNFANGFGIETWFYTEKNTATTVGYLGSGEKHRFLLNLYAQPDNSFFAQLSVGSNGMTLIESTSVQDSRRVAFSYIKPLSGWNHLAVFYRNKTPELYLNGIFIGKAATSIFDLPQNAGYTVPITVNATIGRNANSGFVGMVDEIRVWQNVLGANPAATADAIRTTYLDARDNASLYTGSVHDYWAFEEGSPLATVNGSPYNYLKFEGNVRVVEMSSNEDKLPQNQDYKWFLNGLQVGTGPSYTMPESAVKANSQTYVLKYTGNDNMTCETSKTIQIRKCLTISPITSQNLCEGKTIILTANENVLWYKDGVSASLNTSPSATFTVPGSIEADGVYYAKSSGCAPGRDESDRVAITHVPVPKVEASATPNPAQTGNTVTLKGKVISDNTKEPTYAWTGPSSFTSSLQNPVLTSVTKAAREGVYKFTITETTQNLACTATATVKLLINNCSDFNAGAVVSCSGNLGTITASVSGNTAGRTVEYSLDNTTWQSSNIFSSLLSGIYKVYARSRVTGMPLDQGWADICYANPQEVTVSCGTNCVVQKKLNYDRWKNIAGSEISNFSYQYLTDNVFNKPKSDAIFAPNMESQEKVFDIRDSGANQDFVARMTGFICPPAEGDYKFWVAADNSARFYLNTGSGLIPIVTVNDNPGHHEEFYPSATIHLGAQVGGVYPKYQIEVHHKQGGSSSLIQIQWQLNGGVRQLISAEYLDPANSSNPPNSCPEFELATNPAINLDISPGADPYKIVEGTAIKAIATALNGNTSNFRWEDMQTSAALFIDPKGTSGQTLLNTNSTVPLYIRPSKTLAGAPYEDKVYRVSYTNNTACYKEIKLRVISMTCDCDGGNCEDISVQNPSVITEFSDTKNYVVETVYLDEGGSTGMQTITYMDGLGRPSQKINIQAGPDKQDLVQPIEYDAYGRTPLGYLPYPKAGNGGNFVDNASTNSTSWYGSNKSNNKSYTLTEFEASPLSRVSNQKGPGYDTAELNGNTGITYATNADDIFMFTVNGLTITKGSYLSNTLFKTTSTETAEMPDGSTSTLNTYEYKDRDGKVVCKDVGDQRTYYVYNDIGQLVCVISPEASVKAAESTFTGFTLFTASAFNELIFQYEFNEKGLMKRKKVPGAIAVTMEYDNQDRLMSTTDYRNNEILITKFKYDDINRLIEVREKNGADQDRIVKQVFYDDYVNIPTNYLLPVASEKRAQNMTWNLNTGSLRGLMVGSWEVQYNSNGKAGTDANEFLPTTIYYDTKKRVLQTVNKNHKGFNDYTTPSVDFAGRVLATYQTVTNTGLLVTQTKTGYDFGGRVNAICQKIDNGDYSEKWEPVAQYTYNGIGEMAQKILGCRTQVVDYTYNIRGWLKTINDPANLKVTATKEFDFFGMSLIYTADGNIRQQNYKTAITTAQYNTNGLFTDTYDIQQSQDFSFDYRYDSFKRLQQAELKRATTSVFVLGETGNQNPGVVYDKNGNITSLKRIAKGVTVDNLTYDYVDNNPNQLESIIDGGNNTYAKASSYAYYSDGSMKKDIGRSISDGGITYNSQKLVSKIVANGVNYEYIYTNSDRKLSMSYDTKKYDYIGNAVYLNDKLEFVSNAEGRWLPGEQLKAYNANKTAIAPPPTAKYGRYEYQLKDHLGNLRTACRCVEKPTATAANQAYLPVVTQENHYDPWGMAIEKEVVADDSKLPNFESKDRFTYNGKETQGSLGYLDYGARMYDPSIGRWGVVDPLAEKYLFISPYTYVADNPIKFIDPNGKEIWIGDARYENGKLYDKNGNLYTKKMKKDGSYRGFLGKTVASLDKIRSGGKHGEALISRLQDQSFGIVSIESGTDNSTSGLNVKFNPSKIESGLNEKGKTTRPSFIGLSHELIHVKENKDGITSHAKWYTPQDQNGQPILDAQGRPRTRPFAEISTVFQENQIRAENKIPLREYDGDKKVENERHTINGKSIFFIIFDTEQNAPRSYDFNRDN